MAPELMTEGDDEEMRHSMTRRELLNAGAMTPSAGGTASSEQELPELFGYWIR